MERWEASGLSQAEFCRKEGIPAWKLSEYKRRKRNRDRQRERRRKARVQSIESASVDEPAKRERSLQGRAQPFVPVIPLIANTEVPAVIDGRQVVAAISWNDSLRIDVLSGADVATLRRLFLALKEF